MATFGGETVVNIAKYSGTGNLFTVPAGQYAKIYIRTIGTSTTITLGGDLVATNNDAIRTTPAMGFQNMGGSGIGQNGATEIVGLAGESFNVAGSSSAVSVIFYRAP